MKIFTSLFFLLYLVACSGTPDKMAQIVGLIDARSRYKLNAYKRYHNYFFGLNKQSTFNSRFTITGVYATYHSMQKKLNSMNIEYYPDIKYGASQYEIIHYDESGTIVKIQLINDESSPQRQACYYFNRGKLFHLEKNGIEITDLNGYLRGIDSIHAIVKKTLVAEGLIQIN